MGTKQSDDLGWLHTAINEQATGCSPLICDRIRIFYAMLDDGRLTCAALAKKNKPLSLGQCQTALTAGGQPIHTLGGHLRLDGPLLVSEWR